MNVVGGGWRINMFLAVGKDVRFVAGDENGLVTATLITGLIAKEVGYVVMTRPTFFI